MRLRILVMAAALVGFAGAATLGARGGDVRAIGRVCCAESHTCCEELASCCAPATITPAKQWSIAHFLTPIMVNRTLVSGPVLIVHDDEKMARGEPCTTFYRFEPGSGPKEALVSFHCKPRRAEKVSNTTLTTTPFDGGISRLVEYQLGGDTEAHGVPR